MDDLGEAGDIMTPTTRTLATVAATTLPSAMTPATR
jgi:hypothetical protein